MTDRLFWQDAYAREFTARVVRRTPKGVVLDRTLFYPTSGGQPNDTGTLDGARVVDVVEEGEDVVHVLDGALAADQVKGVIDWERRLDHMQQHDGQHMLSEAFVRVCGANTASFHLGRETSSIDLDRMNVSERDARDAERLANRVVWENRPISIAWHSPEEAAKLPMRKRPPFAVLRGAEPVGKAAEGKPDVAGPVRVVTVQDFDCQACCGTHAKSSGETGIVVVTGWEHDKAGCRVHFVCGWRALERAREDGDRLDRLGAKLSASRPKLVEAVERLQAERAESHKALQAAERQLAEYRAKELAAAAVPRGRAKFVVGLLEKRDIKYLQSLANGIVTAPGLVAILGGTGETSSVVLARSKDVSVDLRPIAKDVFAAVGGRGGGQPHFVQGGGPGSNLREALKLAEDRIAAALAS